MPIKIDAPAIRWTILSKWLPCRERVRVAVRMARRVFKMSVRGKAAQHHFGLRQSRSEKAIEKKPSPEQLRAISKEIPSTIYVKVSVFNVVWNQIAEHVAGTRQKQGIAHASGRSCNPVWSTIAVKMKPKRERPRVM